MFIRKMIFVLGKGWLPYIRRCVYTVHSYVPNISRIHKLIIHTNNIVEE